MSGPVENSAGPSVQRSSIEDVEKGIPPVESTDDGVSKGIIKGGGLTEGDEEIDALPKNNVPLVMSAIGLVLFLSALDISIVSTALPTIAEDLRASPSETSWVGTSYLLGSTVMTPLNGRLSDIVGRKPLLYSAILVFTVFSALCGAAKNPTWLIVARAFQGLGGGSIIALVNMLVADVVPLQDRGKYQGYIGATWGLSSALGPTLGGLLTEKATWRWTFFINLPTCALAFVTLMFTLKLNPTKKHTFREFYHTFDFLGMGLLMVGAALTIVGFARAADYGFDIPSSYGVFTAGIGLLVLAIINCLYTKRIAVIPARMFKIRTTLFFLIGSLLHAFVFIPSNYLLPQLFQGVRGASPLDAGVELLPYSIMVSLGTVIAGMINSYLRIIRPVVWVGYAGSALSFGLFYGLYRYPYTVALQSGLLVLAGLAVGFSLSTPLLIVQAAMPLKEMASSTSAWQLTRTLGGGIGLAIFTAILNTQLRSRFVKIEGYGTAFQVPDSIEGYKALQALPDQQMKDAVLRAFSDSLGVCWIIGCGMFGFALVLTLWTKSYSLNRGPGRAPAETIESVETDAALERKHEEPSGQSPLTTSIDEEAQSRGRGGDTPFSEKTIVDVDSRDPSRERKASNAIGE